MNVLQVAEMPSNAVVFIQMNQLSAAIDDIVQKAIREKRAEDLQEKLLSPEETAKLFVPSISIATLNNYAKEGLLKKHYLGRLTFYKYSEVIESLKTIKRYRRNNS